VVVEGERRLRQDMGCPSPNQYHSPTAEELENPEAQTLRDTKIKDPESSLAGYIRSPTTAPALEPAEMLRYPA
jgi:hypothetical protein